MPTPEMSDSERSGIARHRLIALRWWLRCNDPGGYRNDPSGLLGMKRLVCRFSPRISMSTLQFIFMADCQLGAYASFSGMTPDDVERFAERDMRVEIVPRVKGFEWDATRYRRAIEAANALRPDFVVMGGDMIDDPASQAQYDAVMTITRDLDPAIPMHWVPGNHDIAPDTVVPTPASIDRYRAAFGNDYYGFDHGDARFLVLDTVVIDHPELTGDALDEQMAWLAWEIDRLGETNQRGVILGHHPLFLRDADEEDTYWNLPRARRSHLLDEFRRGRIRNAFAGHWHRNAVAHDGDFEMVTSGPVGYPLGIDPSGLRIVRVESNRIVHHYHALTDFGEGTAP
jgi:3',5'-cyclic AMP phosphodiesterase CpdA